MKTIDIKRVTITDLSKLQKISIQTFSETFSAGNTQENMFKYLEEGFSAEKLAAEVRNQGSEFYFAMFGGEVIGYLKLNVGLAQTEIRDDKALEIERIYVLSEYHGKKVGQMLYNHAVHVAGQKGASYVWLGVWEENLKAIGFYKKNGFEEFDRHVFRLGDDEQTDIMMKKTI